MLKLIILLFAGQLLMSSMCQTMSLSKRGNVQMCGRRLVETLNLFCGGEYYDPDEENSITKRDFIASDVGTNFYPFWFPGLPVRRVNEFGHRQMLPETHRQERGIVDECCKQSCSISVLRSYCRSRK